MRRLKKAFWWASISALVQKAKLLYMVDVFVLLVWVVVIKDQVGVALIDSIFAESFESDICCGLCVYGMKRRWLMVCECHYGMDVFC